MIKTKIMLVQANGNVAVNSPDDLDAITKELSQDKPIYILNAVDEKDETKGMRAIVYQKALITVLLTETAELVRSRNGLMK